MSRRTTKQRRAARRRRRRACHVVQIINLENGERVFFLSPSLLAEFKRLVRGA